VRLLGGDPTLDFVNTVENRAVGGVELLYDYGDLLTWARRSGLLEPGMELSLARQARRSAPKAAEIVRRALAFREALYGVLNATIGGTPPSRADFGAANLEIGRAYASARLEAVAGGFSLSPPERGLDLPLALVARAAAGLLTGSRVQRVRRCEGVGDCGWLFLDATKNGRRRWCSMAGCGARAKTRRQYARKRAVGRK
jgi:predicted RNA-binding Zn ribbon-like protein